MSFSEKSRNARNNFIIMGLKSAARDIIFLYIAYVLIKSGIFNEKISNFNLILFGLIIAIFTLWFLFEKLGIIPKI